MEARFVDKLTIEVLVAMGGLAWRCDRRGAGAEGLRPPLRRWALQDVHLGGDKDYARRTVLGWRTFGTTWS